MRRRMIQFIAITVLLAALIGCSSETPWRRATLDTFRVTGQMVGTTPIIGETLRNANVINDAQLAEIKAIYQKARESYAAAGEVLKLASAAESAVKRDALLAEYSKLLADFQKLAQQIVDMISKWKKVSKEEIMLEITSSPS